ncbi:C40 family peptidase [Brotaphodocola sp.]|uniref:C40 family peptidase n=1 Tax=Brotaphodocola sp. TaxID=3073577 RepID=UPI003D7E82F8
MKIDKRKIYSMIGAMSRMAIADRRKYAAAGLLLMFGCGTAVLGHFCPIRQQEPVVKEVLASEEETDWETEASSLATAEVVADDAGWQPVTDELNLAHYFPDGADQTQITQSLAGQIFKTLMTHDENWISQIYDMSDVTPAQMAQKLGKPQSAVMGKYNPEDSRQKKDDPSTWTINSFKNIRMTASDGDGKAITPYSNVREIMSMANLYTYYKGVTDYDLFLSYAKSLWDQSHSYTVSLSDVYYCDGCIGEDAQLRQKKELEKEAKKEESGISYEDAFLGAESQAESEEEKEGAVSEENLLDDSASTSVVVSNKTSLQRAAEDASRAESKQAAYESSVAEVESSRAAAATKAGLVVSSKKASWQTSSEQDAQESTTVAEVAESSAGTNTESSKDSSTNTSQADSAAMTMTATGSDAAAVSASATATASSKAVASDSKSSKSSGSTGTKSTKGEQTTTSYCPGHVDLIIHMKINGLNEAKQNLFSKDSIGNDAANIGSTETDWPGWNESTMAAARSLAAQDWFEKYGLTVSAFSGRNALTSAEIEAYMAQLPVGLSEERLRIIRFALNSVGKVPYYWGGKASSPNYEGTQFGILTTADYKGRVLKGLDCSGWIGWVYWSVTGKRLPYESTSGLAATGTSISRDQLKPGDIIIRTGTDAHVIMFLGWTSDGKIQCIHESSASVNNVTVAVRDANWPYYRRLIND